MLPYFHKAKKLLHIVRNKIKKESCWNLKKTSPNKGTEHKKII